MQIKSEENVLNYIGKNLISIVLYSIILCAVRFIYLKHLWYVIPYKNNSEAELLFSNILYYLRQYAYFIIPVLILHSVFSKTKFINLKSLKYALSLKPLLYFIIMEIVLWFCVPKYWHFYIKIVVASLINFWAYLYISEDFLKKEHNLQISIFKILSVNQYLFSVIILCLLKLLKSFWIYNFDEMQGIILSYLFDCFYCLLLPFGFYIFFWLYFKKNFEKQTKEE